jgi:diacylglycerol kinase
MTNKRALSFKYAFEGLITAFKDQPNLKFQLCIAVIVLALGYFFQITKAEWLVVILVIGFVLTFELTNTAIEEIVDSFTDQVHPAAKKAKDVAAAAVLAASITAAAIGLFIFLPYII